MSVLVIEKHQIHAFGYKAVLQRVGIEPQFVHDLDAAKEAVDKQQFQVVVLHDFFDEAKKNERLEENRFDKVLEALQVDTTKTNVLVLVENEGNFAFLKTLLSNYAHIGLQEKNFSQLFATKVQELLES